jgi:TPR repeat protein
MKLKNIVFSILLSMSAISLTQAEDVSFSQELVQQAKSGDAIAQNNLGDAYYYGNDVDQDFGKALEWFKKAEILNLPLPTFAENSESKGKIISSKKVETILGYSFQKEI